MKSGKMMVNVDNATTLPTDGMFVEPLSPRAAMFQHTNYGTILATFGFASPADIDSIRAQIPSTMYRNPRFSSLLVGNVKKGEELRWVQIPNANFDNHIIVPSIDTGLSTNSLEADKFVEDYLYNLTKTSMDMSKPLWELHVLDVKTSEADSIGIFRMHHSLGDGRALISSLLDSARQVSKPDALPTIPMSKKKGEDSIKTNYSYFKRTVLAVWWWLRLFWNTITGVVMFLATAFFLRDSNKIIAAFPTNSFSARRIVYKTLSLDDMKSIKNKMNATINDVALGIVEAGLSQYLVRKLKCDTDTKQKKTTLNNVRMRMTMPVSLRPSAGVQSSTGTTEKGTDVKRVGNQFGSVILPLSIKLQDDPLEYVRNAKAAVDRKKCSYEAQFTLKLAAIATKFFGAKVASFLLFDFVRNLSVAVSNVPGPIQEIALFGHPIKFIAPTAYALPLPILIHVLSYMNKMTLVLSVHEDATIDAHQLCDHIAESLALIKDSIMEKGLPV